MGKIRLQVTIRDDIVRWMDKNVESRKFASRSHAIEYSVMQMIKQEKTLST
ncbi:MAG: ribbon-helix-helix domain-containing protein [Candidatus Bathyarchaeota archaeon]|nr:ribbon-helix-helix domain-containing protein [Candidatus Bathyarchaeota archaeon]